MSRIKERAGPAGTGTGSQKSFDAPTNYHDRLIDASVGFDLGDALMNRNYRSWLVDNIVPLRGLTVLGGASGSGKTFVAIDVAVAVASGQPFLGHKTEPSGVIYVSTEDDLENLKRRFVPHADRLNPIRHEVPLRASSSYMNLAADYRAAMRVVEDQINILRRTRGIAPGLIVLDTIQGMSHGLDENSPSGMGLILRFLREIEDRHGCAVMALHHTPQGAERLRGHGSLHAAAQAVLVVRQEGQGGSLSAVKLKSGPGNLKLGFRRRVVSLGNDAWGDEVTTCVIEPAQIEEKTAEQRLSLDLRVIEAIRKNPGISQAEIAKEVQTSVGSVNKTLKCLAEAKKLVRQGGKYRLPETVQNGIHAETTVNAPVNAISVC
jgi:KaiC/GvpD/RAD55 family RecA-like ATPase